MDIDLDRLAAEHHVMFALPIAREVVPQFMIGMMDTMKVLTRYGIETSATIVIGNSNIARARNEAVAKFLASPATDLLFIDSDMGWQASSVLRLLASDKPIIAGVGRKRVSGDLADPNLWCCRFDTQHLATGLVHDGEAVEVVSVGTAFMRIKRGALERMIAAYPDTVADAPDMPDGRLWRLFAWGQDGTGGEDTEFCRRWRELGGRVWIDPEIELAHVGTAEFRGRIGDLMAATKQEG